MLMQEPTRCSGQQLQQQQQQGSKPRCRRYEQRLPYTTIIAYQTCCLSHHGYVGVPLIHGHQYDTATSTSLARSVGLTMVQVVHLNRGL